MEETPEHWKVFLASPGDVPEERAAARHFVESTLPNSAGLRDRLTTRVVSWDDPERGTPFPADLTPLDAVIRFHGRPSECDVVIVILWSRMGTPLDAARWGEKPGGGPYLSGTEWEYLDAFHASPRPTILVYHRTDAPAVPLDAVDFDDKRRQLGLVRQFIAQFTNPDGSARGCYQPFTDLEDFQHKLASDLATIAHERLSRPVPPPEPDTPPPSVTPPERQIGRDADTAAVVGALLAGTAPTAVLIQGVGGIGKTTLTRAAGTHPDVVTRFGPRRWFAELETAASAETATTAILQALGLDARLGFAAVLARLGQAPALLVLDNLEPAWQADGPAIEALLSRLAEMPGLALLVSFRGDEAVQGIAWSLRHTVQPLRPPDDATLFRAIAPGTAPDDPSLPLLLRELGGVPLAICLTARRAVRPGPLAELWAEWQRVGTGIAEWRGTEPGRLTSVPHSIEFSLRSPRLREAGRRLFRLLGALPAGMADADRAQLLGDAAFEARDELLAVGLAMASDGRLDLLPPVRDHASRHHAPDATEAARWRDHYLALVRDLGGKIPNADGIGATERLAPEIGNIEAAMQSAVPAALSDAVGGAFGYSLLTRHTGLGGTAIPRLLANTCHATGDTAGEANCIEFVGDIALSRSDHAAAREAYQQALPLFRQVGQVLGEANCIQSLGNIARERSDHAAAREAYQQALPLYRQVGNVLGEANCIRSLGDIALSRSDHAAAREAYQQALPLYRQVGNVLGEANCIQRLGDIALARSDHTAAREAYQQALPLYRQVGQVLGEANCIQRLGDIALDRSDHTAAREAYQQALPLYRQVGQVLGEANCIQSLGDIALSRSDHAAAREAYQQALPLYRQVGNVVGEANCIFSLGNIALARSDHAAAREAYQQALPLYRQVGQVLGEGNCEAMLGRLARAGGDPDTACARFHAALALFERVGHRGNIALAHEDLACVTIGDERAGHVQAAKDAWAAMDLPDKVAQMEREFG